MSTPKPKPQPVGDAFDDEPTAKRAILPSRLENLFDDALPTSEEEPDEEGALSLVPSWRPGC